MRYEEYINIGFERTEMNCNVEFGRTGYYGFCLEKKINDKMMIGVASGELEFQKLYIKKRNSDTYHILPITCEIVKDIILNQPDTYDFTSAA